MASGTTEQQFEEARFKMVELQLRGRDIDDEAVLAAMRRVPRHRYANEMDPRSAYADHPLPIGHLQTISQPYMVARMVQLCRPGPESRMLEVGVGSGYQAAVLAELCAHVYGAEIVAELAAWSSRMLGDLGVTNVTIEHRDGTLGWPEHAPFDAIVVAAGAPDIPPPLSEQLAEGGRLVIPVGDRFLQTLKCYTKRDGQLIPETDTPCRFVDLQGTHGW